MIDTEGLTGAETLLRVLSHMGVDRIFSSPGSEWSPVWEAFAKAKAQSEGVPLYISSRHEEVAVGMASGYAKSTGKLPAVMAPLAEQPVNRNRSATIPAKFFMPSHHSGFHGSLLLRRAVERSGVAWGDRRNRIVVERFTQFTARPFARS